MLRCAHRGSSVWGPEESGETGGGAPSRPNGAQTQQSLYPARLDLPSERRLVTELTSQRARALALASRSIVVRSGGNSSFHRVPGQKAGRRRRAPAALARRNGNRRRAAGSVLFNPWQAAKDTDRLAFWFLMLCHFLAILNPPP